MQWSRTEKIVLTDVDIAAKNKSTVVYCGVYSIDNDIRHHSSENAVDSRGVATFDSFSRMQGSTRS